MVQSLQQHADNSLKLYYNALLVCIQVCCIVTHLLSCCWKLLGCVATRLVCHGPNCSKFVASFHWQRPRVTFCRFQQQGTTTQPAKEEQEGVEVRRARGRNEGVTTRKRRASSSLSATSSSLISRAGSRSILSLTSAPSTQHWFPSRSIPSHSGWPTLTRPWTRFFTPTPIRSFDWLSKKSSAASGWKISPESKASTAPPHSLAAPQKGGARIISPEQPPPCWILEGPPEPST